MTDSEKHPEISYCLTLSYLRHEASLGLVCTHGICYPPVSNSEAILVFRSTAIVLQLPMLKNPILLNHGHEARMCITTYCHNLYF